MLEYTTSGESHGDSIMATISGFPAGLSVDIDYINQQLAQRQSGYGRGKRMSIEKDQVNIKAGVLKGKTTGSPITLEVKNKLRTIESSDNKMVEVKKELKEVTVPRPGHADFAGYVKYGFDDIRNVIERASARETAARVAAGALFKMLLSELGIELQGYVKKIGSVSIKEDCPIDPEEIKASPLSCPDRSVEKEMIALLDDITDKGDTLGGVFTVVASGVPLGLGSYVSYKARLEGKIAQAMISIPSVKGVEIGDGFKNSGLPGSKVHDEFYLDDSKKIKRSSNRAGGIEGGVTNGQDIIVNCAVKPISTLRSPLKAIDLKTKESVSSRYERSDVCIVPAAALIGETMLGFVLCREFLEKFGSDYIEDIKANYKSYKERISEYI